MNKIVFVVLLLAGTVAIGLWLPPVNADTRIQETLFQPTVRTGLPPLTTPTYTPSATASPTLTLSPTLTQTATRTPTPTATASMTRTPSRTPTASPSRTATPTRTSTRTPSPTPSATSTFTATTSASPTQTATTTTTGTPTMTVTTTGTVTGTTTITTTATITTTPTITGTATPTASATITWTPSPSPSPTHTSTATATFTPSATSTRIPPVVESTRPDDSGNDPLSPILLIAGIVVTLAIGGYMVMYATSAAAVDRYASGFIISRCPVCEVGHLDIEERGYRVALIPRVRRTVRCDNCRSVLREVGRRRWRYAVDPAANESLYEQLNNRVLREDQLLDIMPDYEYDTPYYIDEE